MRLLFALAQLAAALAAAGTAHAQPAELIVVSTGTSLIRFSTASPGQVTLVFLQAGQSGGETLVGIDVRPANSTYYGVGSLGHLFTFNPFTGLGNVVNPSSQFTLSGQEFGTSFDPVADRIRVVGSNTGQNLRINPDTGALAGTDTPLPASSRIGAVAYSNPVGAATTLFGIDTSTQDLVRIGSPGGTPNPPDSGIVEVVGNLNLAPPPAGFGPRMGFDISPLTGRAYAALQVQGLYHLYAIDLTTAAATDLGLIGTGNWTTGLQSLVAPGVVPEPSSLALGWLASAALVGGRWRRRRAAVPA